MRDRKKKSKNLRFASLYHWEMELQAFRHLSVYGRALLMEFRRAYNGHNNGSIVMSHRQAASLLKCNKDTAGKAIEELKGKGWIRLRQKGSFSQKTNKTASTWRITNQPIGAGVDTPETKEYAKWRPGDEIQNTVPPDRTVCPTTSDRKRKNGPNTSDRTPPVCPITSDRAPPKTPSNGPTTSDTYISAIRGAAGGPSGSQPATPHSPSQNPIKKNSNSSKQRGKESGNAARKPANGPALKSDTYEKAHDAAPGYDIYFIEERWRSSGFAAKAKKPDAAFLGFVRKHVKENPL